MKYSLIHKKIETIKIWQYYFSVELIKNKEVCAA